MKQVSAILTAYLGILSLLLFTGCEQPFLPETDDAFPDLVVEGYIEAGPDARPPYVILTRTQPFYGVFDSESLSGLFVHDARVEVKSQNATFVLQEVCLTDLNPDITQLLLSQFGIAEDSIAVDFCIYTDLSLALKGEIGLTYDLFIEAEGRVLSARTIIPEHVPIDSFRFVSPSASAPDSLKELRGWLTDPAGQPNYYRFMTRVGKAPWYPGLNSVVNDRFFDGGSFEFPIPKGEPIGADIDPATFGLFTLKDTLEVRWLSIDEQQYDFWNTLEFNTINQGPFSSYTRIDGNIEGGLGVWGGLSVSSYQLIVE